MNSSKQNRKPKRWKTVDLRGQGHSHALGLGQGQDHLREIERGTETRMSPQGLHQQWNHHHQLHGGGTTVAVRVGQSQGNISYLGH